MRWFILISQKVMGYLLFFMDDVGKRKEAYRALDRQKEKPVTFAGGNGQRKRLINNLDGKAVV
jgi:hypothetical protein